MSTSYACSACLPHVTSCTHPSTSVTSLMRPSQGVILLALSSLLNTKHWLVCMMRTCGVSHSKKSPHVSLNHLLRCSTSFASTNHVATPPRRLIFSFCSSKACVSAPTSARRQRCQRCAAAMKSLNFSARARVLAVSSVISTVQPAPTVEVTASLQIARHKQLASRNKYKKETRITAGFLFLLSV